MTIEAIMIDTTPLHALRGGGAGASGGAQYFKMAGVSTVDTIPMLVTWVANGKPDTTGASYAGPGTTPTGIYISHSWFDK